MTTWVHRTLIPNTTGTATTVTYNFTAAAAGNLLVAVCGGPVTWTTPAGWALERAMVAASGLYVFTKIATAGESSFTSTHNGSGGANYGDFAVVYEFPSGSTLIGSVGVNNGQTDSGTMPSLGSLTGTNSIFSAMTETVVSNPVTPSMAWGSSVSDTDVTADSASSDSSLFIGVLDGYSGASFADTYVVTNPLVITGNASQIAFAVNVSTPASGLKIYRGSSLISAIYRGTQAIDKIYKGTTQVWP